MYMHNSKSEVSVNCEIEFDFIEVGFYYAGMYFSGYHDESLNDEIDAAISEGGIVVYVPWLDGNESVFILAGNKNIVL